MRASFSSLKAKSDDDEIDVVPTVERFDPRGEFRRGSGALHGGGDDQKVCRRKPPTENADHIPDRRSRRGGDDPDFLRIRRQGFLAFRVEQPLSAEFVFQGFVGEPERTDPVAGQMGDVKLINAVLRVERNAPPRDDRETVREREGDALRLTAEHHAADQSLSVFEREVDVPRPRQREVRDLAAHRNRRENVVPVEERLDVGIQLRDREDAVVFRQGPGKIEGLLIHGSVFPPSPFRR